MGVLLLVLRLRVSEAIFLPPPHPTPVMELLDLIGIKLFVLAALKEH
jgi:hypothetical protein